MPTAQNARPNPVRSAISPRINPHPATTGLSAPRLGRDPIVRIQNASYLPTAGIFDRDLFFFLTANATARGALSRSFLLERPFFFLWIPRCFFFSMSPELYAKPFIWRTGIITPPSLTKLWKSDARTARSPLFFFFFFFFLIFLHPNLESTLLSFFLSFFLSSFLSSSLSPIGYPFLQTPPPPHRPHPRRQQRGRTTNRFTPPPPGGFGRLHDSLIIRAAPPPPPSFLLYSSPRSSPFLPLWPLIP